MALAILPNRSDSPVSRSFDGAFFAAQIILLAIRWELQFDDYFFRRRSFVRRAIAAGAWSGMAKTELTLISQST